ncbi:MAG: 3-phosphoglycerate dehydrogenase [Bacteroidetes bacterium]|jgi:D-3-phosphoglycerate dehydrogenase|nr:3-phosphoglycerate dehydrogenase [Bacteroidota bacterium]
MMKILANDGIDTAGEDLLRKAGFSIDTQKIPQAELAAAIKNYDILIVRSATKVTADIMDAGNLKLIARAGVGLDNIDIKHAGIKHIPVVNTPNASSRSVAELVFAHIFSCYRYLYHTNREMPSNGIKDFNELKKLAGKGFEVQDKKIGIIGFGRIGQEVARMAVGLGMEVLASDYKKRDIELTLSFHRKYAYKNFKIVIPGMSMDDVLKNSDIITLHTPGSNEVIGEKELAKMKYGAMLINCARGGVVNETALKNAVSSGKIAFAGVDVFEQEPPVNNDMLQLSNVSLSPHIGASTAEAQERVGIELAERIIQFFNTKR